MADKPVRRCRDEQFEVQTQEMYERMTPELDSVIYGSRYSALIRAVNGVGVPEIGDLKSSMDRYPEFDGDPEFE